MSTTITAGFGAKRSSEKTNLNNIQ